MKNTNKLLILLLLTSCILWFQCGDDDNPVNSENKYSADEPFSSTVEVVNQTRFRLEGITGTISVTGKTNTNTITITGEKRIEAKSNQEAQDHLGDLEVDVQNLPNEIFVRTIQPENTQGRNYIVNYTITLPQDLEIKIGNVTGTVTTASINNRVAINVVTGDVVVDNITGNTSVQLVTGSINGKVSLPVNGTLDMSTVTGGIQLALPTSTSAQFSASVITGGINISGLVLQNQNTSANSRSGQLGDGKGTVFLRVITGSIVVTGF